MKQFCEPFRKTGIAEQVKRDYSVTQLLNPAKIIHLTNRHRNEIEDDVSERIWMLIGSAMHAIRKSSRK